VEEEDANGEADANVMERIKVGAVDRVQTPADLHNSFRCDILAIRKAHLGLLQKHARVDATRRTSTAHVVGAARARGALMNLKGRRSSTMGRELLEACNTREASVHATELLNRRS